MKIQNVSENYSVADQLRVSDLEQVASLGFGTVINNRPDNEVEHQPESADMAVAAEALGLTYLHIPVTFPNIPADTIDDFANAYSTAKGPILAFCASGMRSITLWALNEAGTQDVDAILNTTAAAGYDLSVMSPALEAQSAAMHHGRQS